jgi:hypothetical protein
MTTATRWTVRMPVQGTAFAAWFRRKDDEARRKAELHEWENEGGTLVPSAQAGTASS